MKHHAPGALRLLTLALAIPALTAIADAQATAPVAQATVRRSALITIDAKPLGIIANTRDSAYAPVETKFLPDFAALLETQTANGALPTWAKVEAVAIYGATGGKSKGIRVTGTRGVSGVALAFVDADELAALGAAIGAMQTAPAPPAGVTRETGYATRAGLRVTHSWDEKGEASAALLIGEVAPVVVSLQTDDLATLRAMLEAGAAWLKTQ